MAYAACVIPNAVLDWAVRCASLCSEGYEVSLAAIVFTLASLHLNDSRDYQEINPGVGLEWCCAAGNYLAGGTYVNSSARLSVYGAVGRRFFGPRIGIGVDVGGVTGYRVPVLPLVFPYVYVSRGAWSLKVDVLPIRRPILGFQLRVSY